MTIRPDLHLLSVCIKTMKTKTPIKATGRRNLPSTFEETSPASVSIYGTSEKFLPKYHFDFTVDFDALLTNELLVKVT